MENGVVVGGKRERYASQKKKEDGEERDPPQRTNHEAASYHTHNAHAMQRRRSCETALICPKGPHMAPPFPPPLLLFLYRHTQHIAGREREKDQYQKQEPPTYTKRYTHTHMGNQYLCVYLLDIFKTTRHIDTYTGPATQHTRIT